MDAQLYDLAALFIAVAAVGAILAQPDVAPESKAAALGVIIGGLLIVAAMRRRHDL